jgi:hypothetical protein
MATRVEAPEITGAPHEVAHRTRVVDNDAANRALSTLTLRLAGFSVNEAELVERSLDGLGLAAALRGDPRTIEPLVTASRLAMTNRTPRR